MMHPAGTRGNVRMLKCTLVNMIFMGGCKNLAYVGANGTQYYQPLGIGTSGMMLAHMAMLECEMHTGLVK